MEIVLALPPAGLCGFEPLRFRQASGFAGGF
jgi:hypothetical protein